jgi:Protein of unknown function (DUF2939)
MRWTIRIGLLLLALLAAYTAWPLVALYQMASAIEARNSTDLAGMIELPMLRRSLTEQIVAEYLKLSGKASRLGAMGTSLATGIGATIADPIVARLLNLENLIDLLNKGSADVAGASRISLDVAPLNPSTLSNVWQTWLNTEYAGTRFEVSLPPDKPATQQFKVRLHLIGWQWKLTGIALPEPLRVQLAQEVLRTNPP